MVVETPQMESVFDVAPNSPYDDCDDAEMKMDGDCDSKSVLAELLLVKAILNSDHNYEP